MNLSKEYSITKYNNGTEKELLDKVVVEYELSILLNQQLYKKIICSPSSLKALVIGELVTEQVIYSTNDIKELIIDERQGIASVIIYDYDKGIDEEVVKRKEEILITEYKSLLSLFKQFVSSSELFISTGGVHSCAITDGVDILFHQDDISRQNALNKVIGDCYMQKLTMNDKLLLTSCRISSEIMNKVIHSGIKVLVSKSAPTNVAIELAQKYDITLLGFLRDQNMNIYHR